MTVTDLPAGLAGFALCLWLGLYLLDRDPRCSAYRWTAAGLLAFAAALALDLLSLAAGGVPGATASLLAAAARLAGLAPAPAWAVACLELLPEDDPWRRPALRFATPAAAVLAVSLLLATAAGALDSEATYLRTSVPQRTLHNWQNEAAAALAADLRRELVAVTDRHGTD